MKYITAYFCAVIFIGDNMEKEIAIIIPAYNAHDTIKQLLFSIAAQTVKDKTLIILIDDCSNQDYYYLLEEFPFLDLTLLKTEKNSGPGVARNLGISYVIKKNIPYIVFCDADDLIIFNLFLENGLKEIQNADFVFSNFYESSVKGVIAHLDNDVWLFGKFYKTEIIKKHEIKFIGNSYSNEDVTFNLWYWLCCDKKIHLNYFTYLWQYAKNSLTRKDNHSYSFTSYPSICRNLQEMYEKVEQDSMISKEKIQQSILDRILRMYLGFNEFYSCAEEGYKQDEWLFAIKELYKTTFEKYINNFTDEDFQMAWEILEPRRIPRIGFVDFLKKIRED